MKMAIQHFMNKPITILRITTIINLNTRRSICHVFIKNMSVCLSKKYEDGRQTNLN